MKKHETKNQLLGIALLALQLVLGTAAADANAQRAGSSGSGSTTSRVEQRKSTASKSSNPVQSRARANTAPAIPKARATAVPKSTSGAAASRGAVSRAPAQAPSRQASRPSASARTTSPVASREPVRQQATERASSAGSSASRQSTRSTQRAAEPAQSRASVRSSARGGADNAQASSARSTTTRSATSNAATTRAAAAGSATTRSATTRTPSSTGRASATVQESGNRSRTNVRNTVRASTDSQARSDARGSTANRASQGGRTVIGNRSTLNGQYRAPLRSAGIAIRRSPVARYFPRIRIFARPVLQVRWPRIHVHITWPWVIRARRYWAPRYRYRQVVTVQATAGARARSTRVELETHYQHRVLSANDNRAELEISIEAIDVYYEGRHLGSVDYIPANLAKIYATVYSNGEIQFDREVFLLGDPFTGFELISTRYYDGYVLDQFRYEDGYYAGRIDLRTGSVREISRSRLFDPYSSAGYIPISLLPENEGWLWDYGADAISAATDDYQYYYGSDQAGFSESSAYRSDPLRSSDEYQFRTNSGTDVRMTKETEIQRIE